MIKVKKIMFAPNGDRRLKKWNYLKEASVMNSFIENGDVIYDCGANIFDHSIFFALNNPQSKIIAFEPVKEYFEMGKNNASYFNVKNLIPLNVALGDTEGELEISVDNEGSSLTFDHSSSKKELVRIETIDHLVSTKQIPKPGFIKIDVEGFALPLLKGSLETIKNSKPIIIIEVHPQFVGFDEAKEKIRLLESLGYKVIRVLDMGREFVLSINGREIEWESIFEKEFVNGLIWEARNLYDNSKNKCERDAALSKYREITKKYNVPFFKKMIWSKIYVFFKFDRFFKSVNE